MKHQTSNTPWWVQLFRSFREFPLDLAAAAGYVVLTGLLIEFTVVGATPFRLALTLPVLFFLPGYVLLAVVFPGRSAAEASVDRSTALNEQRLRFGTIDSVERLALSFGMSVALIPLLAMALAATPWPYSLESVLGVLTAFVVVGVVIGTVRRLRLPKSARYAPWRWFMEGDGLLRGGRPADVALNALLAATVLLALGAAGYALAAPQAAESYTSLYIGTQDGSGEVVAADFPAELTAGEGHPLTVGVENHEGVQTTYTVLVELQRVGTGNAGTVTERQEVARMQRTLAPGETWTEQHTVTPELTGDRLRLQYYLYEGDAPATPSAETAYRRAHLWVSVVAADG